jgi:hypothetical protein
MKQPLPSQGLKMTISYLHLLSYCPPHLIWHFQQASSPLRNALAYQANMTERQYFAAVLPVACKHIVTFHQGKFDLNEADVQALTAAAHAAYSSPQAATKFSQVMTKIANSPTKTGRENRLENKLGFRHNSNANRYVYFALVSNPDYAQLREVLQQENGKSASERDPLGALWTFTIAHLRAALGTPEVYISADHLGNLAYCMLNMSMYSSRYPFPDAAIKVLNTANQARINSWATAS